MSGIFFLFHALVCLLLVQKKSKQQRPAKQAKADQSVVKVLLDNPLYFRCSILPCTIATSRI